MAWVGLESVENKTLGKLFDTFVRKKLDVDQETWARSLPWVIDVLNMRLKEYADCDWRSGQRGTLKQEGLVKLSEVVRDQIQRVNRQWTEARAI